MKWTVSPKKLGGKITRLSLHTYKVQIASHRKIIVKHKDESPAQTYARALTWLSNKSTSMCIARNAYLLWPRRDPEFIEMHCKSHRLPIKHYIAVFPIVHAETLAQGVFTIHRKRMAICKDVRIRPLFVYILDTAGKVWQVMRGTMPSIVLRLRRVHDLLKACHMNTLRLAFFCWKRPCQARRRHLRRVLQYWKTHYLFYPRCVREIRLQSACSHWRRLCRQILEYDLKKNIWRQWNASRHGFVIVG